MISNAGCLTLMAATLYELWRLALPPTTELRSGQRLPVVIRAAVILRPTQPALPDLHGGEIVLISPALLERLDARLALGRLLERLEHTPIAAVAFAGPVDAAAIQAADRTEIALFELPANADLRSVQREIERLLTDAEAQYERRAAQLYAAITRNRTALDTIPALLSTLDAWTGARTSFPADSDAATLVPVYVAGHRVGTLGSSSDQQWDRLALEQGTAALALILEREQVIEERLRGSVIDTLLAGIPLDAGGLSRAVEQGIDLNVPYALIALRPSQASLHVDRVQAATRRIVDRLQLRAVIACVDTVLLLALPQSGDLLGEDTARTIHAHLVDAALLVDGGFALAPEPGDWASAWQAALNGLQLGRELLGAGRLAGTTELGIYRLLLTISDSEIAHAFYAQTVAALVDHDSRQDGDLTYTLQMFFNHLGNHSQAAAALHIHRNTLLYRLGRITAITGHYLDRAADRLALQVGLALHRIYQTQHNPSNK